MKVKAERSRIQTEAEELRESFDRVEKDAESKVALFKNEGMFIFFAAFSTFTLNSEKNFVG